MSPSRLCLHSGRSAFAGEQRELLVHLIRHLTRDRLSLEDTEDTGRRLRRRWEGLIAPVAHVQSDSAESELQLALVGLRGRLRLLAGMVRDNRPWRLVPHLSTATAAAAATAAYGLVNTSFWNLADSLPTWRLAIVNAVAVVSMAVWILVYKHLWDRPEDPVDREAVALNNVSTLVTLTLGVAFIYAILYSLTLLAAAALVDSGYLHSQLGHPAGDRRLRDDHLAGQFGRHRRWRDRFQPRDRGRRRKGHLWLPRTSAAAAQGRRRSGSRKPCKQSVGGRGSQPGELSLHRPAWWAPAKGVSLHTTMTRLSN